MSDDIRVMTAVLAADPTSLVFLRLGEALRHAGRLDAAAKVARQGLVRYPNLPEAHDLYARILVDQEDLEAAFDEWDMTLRLDPVHGGAQKGLAFLFYRAGDFPAALRHLLAAAADLPGDTQVQAAITRVQARLDELPPSEPAPAGAEPAFPALVEPAPAARLDREESPAAVVPSAEQLLEDDGLLLVDSAGLRLLGTLERAGGVEVAERVAAELAGVSREAARAARLLNLGEWKTLTLETAKANYFLAPPTGETLLLVIRDANIPMGRVAMGSMRAVEAARRWLVGDRGE